MIYRDFKAIESNDISKHCRGKQRVALARFIDIRLFQILCAILAGSVCVAAPAAAQVVPRPAPIRPSPGPVTLPTPEPPQTEDNLSRLVADANAAAEDAIKAQNDANNMATKGGSLHSVTLAANKASGATGDAEALMGRVARLLKARVDALTKQINALHGTGPGVQRQREEKQRKKDEFQRLYDQWMTQDKAWNEAAEAWKTGAEALGDATGPGATAGGSLGKPSTAGIPGTAAAIAAGASAALLMKPPKAKPQSP